MEYGFILSVLGVTLILMGTIVPINDGFNYEEQFRIVSKLYEFRNGLIVLIYNL